MKTSLGSLEMRVFAYAQLRGTQLLRRAELASALRLRPQQAANLLNRLVRAGMIARVRPGVYLVPERLALGGAWSPDPALALESLMRECGARYQICGPNAFQRYGFDDQLPNRTYAYNDKLSGEYTVGQVELTLIKVAPERLGDTETLRSAAGIESPCSSRARTLVDAVYDWSRFNGLPRAAEWIRGELRAGRVNAPELVALALRYGDVSTRRRMGALLEREGVAAPLLAKLERGLHKTSGSIPFLPSERKRGTLDRRWGVVWNALV